MMMSLIRYLYSLFFYLLTPYLLLRLWWKGRTLAVYRQGIAQRFGVDAMQPVAVDSWVHAVSLGEVIAISPLIEQLLQNNQRVLITTMTPTGALQVKKQFGSTVLHRYIPYEYPFALRRFFNTFKPKTGIIVETELWPNLIHYAHQFGVRLLLVNARLSQRSFRGYAKLAWFFKAVLRDFNGIYTQDAASAERFRALGAEADRVQVIGNIKFDLQIKTVNLEPFLSMKTAWGDERVIVIAASTHENEEAQLLSILRLLQQKIPQVLLLIAPRHPERFTKIYDLAVALGFNTGLRSHPSSLQPANEVVVLDSLGELLGFYAISDYAFVGGSLVPVGGHNVLEPIAMQVPVFTGPYLQNFLAISNVLFAEKALIKVQTIDDFLQLLVALHQNPLEKHRLKQAASRVFQDNQGALLRYLQIVLQHQH